MTCFVSAKKEKQFKKKKKSDLKKTCQKRAVLTQASAHLGKGNGPLKSSHLKRSPYRK